MSTYACALLNEFRLLLFFLQWIEYALRFAMNMDELFECMVQLCDSQNACVGLDMRECMYECV